MASGEKNQSGVTVRCKYVGCGKLPRDRGKRVYVLMFQADEAVDGGPPVGTGMDWTVRAEPEHLFDFHPVKQKKQFGLVSRMQWISTHLHSPEQLISEAWEFAIAAEVKFDYSEFDGQTRWRMTKWKRVLSAREVVDGEKSPLPPPAPNVIPATGGPPELPTPKDSEYDAKLDQAF